MYLYIIIIFQYYMTTISNKEAALLGLLSEGPKYPYEIEKEIYNRSMRDWTEISMSSVYKVLERLEGKKMVTSEVKLTVNNRTQKVYAVTSEGTNSMREWVAAKLSGWEKSLWPVDIAMSNLQLLSRDEIAESFRQYIKSVDEAIKCYTDLLEYLKIHCQFHSLSLALRPIHLLKADRKWARSILSHYSHSDSHTQPPHPAPTPTLTPTNP